MVVASSPSPRFKGIRKRSWGKWVSEIRLPRSRDRVWLGSYSTPLEAARAYDAAASCLRGASASLNFPNSPPCLPLLPPEKLSRQDIQSIAAAAAASVAAEDSVSAAVKEHHLDRSPSSVIEFEATDLDDFCHDGAHGLDVSAEEASFYDILDDLDVRKEYRSLSTNSDEMREKSWVISPRFLLPPPRKRITRNE